MAYVYTANLSEELNSCTNEIMFPGTAHLIQHLTLFFIHQSIKPNMSHCYDCTFFQYKYYYIQGSIHCSDTELKSLIPNDKG
jgi:hypothetical protein